MIDWVSWWCAFWSIVTLVFIGKISRVQEKILEINRREVEACGKQILLLCRHAEAISLMMDTFEREMERRKHEEN